MQGESCTTLVTVMFEFDTFPRTCPQTTILNPIQAGGGGTMCPPTGFFLAVLKRLAVV